MSALRATKAPGHWGCAGAARPWRRRGSLTRLFISAIVCGAAVWASATIQPSGLKLEALQINNVKVMSTQTSLTETFSFAPRANSRGDRNWHCPRSNLVLQCVLAAALAAVFSLHAQWVGGPSGGPYGPVHKHYELPKDARQIYVVSPDGKPDAQGTLDEPTTIDSAFARVVTGDAIVLRGGTYRVGNLLLNQGVTIQPYGDERPVLKGTLVATNWISQPNGLWRTKWPRLFPAKPAEWWRRETEGKKTPPWLFNNDMVFVDGRPLKAVGWEGAVEEGSFYIDYVTGEVYIGLNPSGHTIEITAWDVAIRRTTGECHGKQSDKKGFIMRGVTLTQYANRALEIEGTEPEGPADPATFGKDVVGTVLEDVTITHCSRVAGYLRGDKMVIRNCLVSDTSTEGLYLLASSDCLLEKNIFRRNNVENITGYFPAAVKIFNQTHRVVCRDNLVLEQTNSCGIWYDVGNVDGVFVNNWVQDCIDGFFFEISKGAICAGNVFVNCDKGIRVLNSSNVRMYNNTLVNTVASIERTSRSAVGDHFGWHPATGPDVDKREGHVFVGNLIVADERFQKPLLRVEQTSDLCGKLTRPQLDVLDYNLYVRLGGAPSGRALYVWSPVEGRPCVTELKTPEDLHKLHPAFDAHSVYLNGVAGPLLRSIELGHYEPVAVLPLAVPASAVPAEVVQLLSWPKRDVYQPGAYQVENRQQ